MVIFNSYVKLPEGSLVPFVCHFSRRRVWFQAPRAWSKETRERYPLVICYSWLLKMAIETLIYLLKMVIFHSYVGLPEGISFVAV